jgi:hypothetical protein
MPMPEPINIPQLHKEFDERLRRDVEECRKIGYQPTRFEEMLRTSDGCALAKRMVKPGILQDGLKKLAELNRLDLALESVMLEPKFQSLFNGDELDAAKWRLEQVKKGR